jgi:Uma2 family endonuclease
MSTGTLVSLEEYLNTSYEPDLEYVDGELRDRNVGETGHGRIQAQITHKLLLLAESIPIQIMTETRVHTAGTRYRVPDVSVVLGEQELDRYLYEPPFLCVEVLSPDDRAGEIQEKLDEYLVFGVRFVWIVNPKIRRGYVYTNQGSAFVAVAGNRLFTRDPELIVDLEDVFLRTRV